MKKVRFARMSKRARVEMECGAGAGGEALPEASLLDLPDCMYGETDFSWVHHVPLILPTKKWPIPHVPYRYFKVCCCSAEVPLQMRVLLTSAWWTRGCGGTDLYGSVISFA